MIIFASILQRKHFKNYCAKEFYILDTSYFKQL